MCTKSIYYVKHLGGYRPVVSWKDGQKMLNPEVESPLPDAVLLVGGGGEVDCPRFAALTHFMMPWRGRHVRADGGVVEVQSFRSVGIAGNVHHVMYCASCGRLARCDGSNIEKVGVGDCPGCGEIASAKACPRFHNWGFCPQCDGGIERASRSAALADEVVSARRRAGEPPDHKGGALGSLAGSATQMPTTPGVPAWNPRGAE